MIDPATGPTDRMKRGDFLAVLGGAAAWPLAAHAPVKWFAEYDPTPSE
jgi:hypothetical protein